MSAKVRTPFVVQLFFLLLILAIGAGGVAYFQHFKRERIQRQLEIERRNLKRARRYITHLLGENRVAEFRLMERVPNEDGPPTMKLEFQEFGTGGEALKPRLVSIPGEEVYFDAVLIVFKPEEVMSGQSRSLHLFRRVFTNEVKPEEGEILWKEEQGDIPEVYRAPDVPLEIQRRVWKDIVLILTDEQHRKNRGVRAVFGQAVSTEPRLGVTYKLSLQNNGGLILEKKTPATEQDQSPEDILKRAEQQ